MPDNEATPYLIIGGTVVAIGGIWWWTSRDKGDNGNGGGNGGPPPPPEGGLKLNAAMQFKAATFGGGSNTVGLGGTLPIGNAISVATIIPASVTNTSQTTKYLGTNMRLQRIVSNLPDITWVRSNPQGIVEIETEINLLSPRAFLAKPEAILPGQTRTFNLGFSLQGPANSFADRVIWLANFNPEFGMRIELVELTGQSATTGRRVAFEDWHPAFKTQMSLFGAGVRRVTRSREARQAVHAQAIKGQP